MRQLPSLVFSNGILSLGVSCLFSQRCAVVSTSCWQLRRKSIFTCFSRPPWEWGLLFAMCLKGKRLWHCAPKPQKVDVAGVPAWAGIGGTPNSHMYTQLVLYFNMSCALVCEDCEAHSCTGLGLLVLGRVGAFRPVHASNTSLSTHTICCTSCCSGFEIASGTAGVVNCGFLQPLKIPARPPWIEASSAQFCVCLRARLR